ncbi:MAG: FecR domain-containing protein [Roseivirga sp.]
MYGEEHHIMWQKEWLEGKISREDAKARAGEGEDIVALLKSGEVTSGFDVKTYIPKAVAWEMLEEKILAAKNKKSKVITMPRRYWITGVAASFILAIGALFLLSQPDQAVFDTAKAESNTVTLPSGSAVYLNANSTISYSEKTWARERLVELEGEAFFEVTKGNRFVVSTEFGSVEVLGTSFNVRVRNQQLVVSCKTGKVRVSSPTNSSSQIITPGLRVVVKAGVVGEPEEIGIDQVDNWRDGEYDFESVLLTEVLEELSRQFDIELKYDKNDPQIKDRIYNGYFSNKDLSEAIQLICNPMGLKYKTDDSTVTIYSETEM